MLLMVYLIFKWFGWILLGLVLIVSFVVVVDGDEMFVDLV